MYTAKITVILSMLIATLSPPLNAHDYNAVDEQGVRIFSPVPEVGVHPRVLMSPRASVLDWTLCCR